MLKRKRDGLSRCPACDERLAIHSYRCPACATEVVGDFAACAFCAMDDEDRYFSLVFLQCEGSIKDVERVMGISYPTVKGRLARVRSHLQSRAAGPAAPARDDAAAPVTQPAAPDRMEVLGRLERGEIDFDGAMRLLQP